MTEWKKWASTDHDTLDRASLWILPVPLVANWIASHHHVWIMHHIDTDELRTIAHGFMTSGVDKLLVPFAVTHINIKAVSRGPADHRHRPSTITLKFFAYKCWAAWSSLRRWCVFIAVWWRPRRRDGPKHWRSRRRGAGGHPGWISLSITPLAHEAIFRKWKGQRLHS